MATKYLIFVVAFNLAAVALGSPYLENFPQTNHVVDRAVARAAAIRPQPKNWYPGQGLYIRTENGSSVAYHACQTRFFPNERNCAEAFVQGREGEVNVLSEVGTTPLPRPQDSTPPLPLLPSSQIPPTYPPSPYNPPTSSPSNTFHTAHFQSYKVSPSHFPPNPATPSSQDFHPPPSPQSPYLPVSPQNSQPSDYPSNYPLYNQRPPQTPRQGNRFQQLETKHPSQIHSSQQPTQNWQGQSPRKRKKAGQKTILREERRVVNNEPQEKVQDKYIFENWRYYHTTRRFHFVGNVDRKVYDENIQQGHYGDRNTNVPLDCFRYCLETQGQIRQCSRDICNPLRV